jgi:SAM-dependent methyltransferase
MVKQVIKGIATFIPGAYDTFSPKRTGGTESARYSYSVWLRHLVMAQKNGLSEDPKIVAELGPGDSIGIGLAALISGAEKYYAFDIVEYASVSKTVVIFDELVELFKNKAAIPGEKEFPNVGPKLSSYAFPNNILTDDRLYSILEKDRLNSIRQSIVDINKDGSVIHYQVPWYDFNFKEEETIDMIFSQAVLEHVDELHFTYEKMHAWLKPGGFMSHSIDFKSHGSASDWNGQWTYSDFVWELIKGKRPYLINRVPHSQHIKLIKETGFKLICDIKNLRPSKIKTKNLARRFRNMSQEDLITSGVFIEASKR